MADVDAYSAESRERLYAAVIRRLIAGDRTAVAFPMLDGQFDDVSSDRTGSTYVGMVVGAEAFDGLAAATYQPGPDDGSWGPERWDPIPQALRECLPPGEDLVALTVRVRLDDVSPGWRESAQAALIGGKPNQGNLVSKGGVTYNGRSYRSRDEILIARELDRRGILFMPLPSASRGRVLREPDFVIVQRGKVGILEVDGHFHTGRAADDHKRDMLFQDSGVFVWHVNGDDVRANPTMVVDKFLELLHGGTR